MLKPTHYCLPFSTCSFTSFAEVFSQVVEYFVELVCPLSIPIFMPNGVDVYVYFRFQIGFPEDDILFRAAFASLFTFSFPWLPTMAILSSSALKADAPFLRRVAFEQSGRSGKQAAAATFSSSLQPSV
ncbi:hypothetical protein PoB_002251600 [Plakobranchus ocellatus]|uniref:Uncharacterized protein n=1 Tax=Plakobranchus ocellatus TaxID=259542 RepID=A0AAV3ZNA9_9GAST|nr:hypothetical protein PoB_002251600 [Plakobranchus ocellatus]